MSDYPPSVDSPVGITGQQQSAEMQKITFATRETTWIVVSIPDVIDAALYIVTTRKRVYLPMY